MSDSMEMVENPMLGTTAKTSGDVEQALAALQSVSDSQTAKAMEWLMDAKVVELRAELAQGYRFVHDECGGSLEEWSIQCLATVTYDKTLFPDALLDMEDMCIRSLRRCGHPLLNRNRAKGGDRRAYMRAWRARNPGYMARKGREHRERRRLAALALTATNEVNEGQ